jgi:hypothetical protein
MICCEALDRLMRISEDYLDIGRGETSSRAIPEGSPDKKRLLLSATGTT